MKGRGHCDKLPRAPLKLKVLLSLQLPGAEAHSVPFLSIAHASGELLCPGFGDVEVQGESLAHAGLPSVWHNSKGRPTPELPVGLAEAFVTTALGPASPCPALFPHALTDTAAKGTPKAPCRPASIS